MKKGITPALLLLLISSIACSSADYAAVLNIEYETQDVPILPEMTLEAIVPLSTSTLSPTWYVCTGIEKGVLRVRNSPGVSGIVESLLDEGAQIYPTEKTAETNDGATWIEVTTPRGWVNQKYICKK